MRFTIRSTRFWLSTVFVASTLLTFGCTGIGPVHNVSEGETLSEIAKIYGKTVDELVKYNEIKNPNLIKPGQQIKVTGQ